MVQVDTKTLSELLPFWKDLKESEKKEITEKTIRHFYENRQNIHGGFGDCTGIIAVKSGRLRVYLLSEEGKEVTLFRLLENEVCLLSASCIMKNISFDIYIDTECATEIFITSASCYDKIAKENPAVENFMRELVSMRFYETMWAMEQILFMKFDKRLAIFLLDQAKLEKGDTITLTHEQIAGHLGSAREVVSRMLKYFSNEGIISLSRRDIKIIDRKKLAEYT